MQTFWQETGIPVALDETVDEHLAGLAPHQEPSLPASREAGVSVLVVKPAVVGGFERVGHIARWAHARDMQVGRPTREVHTATTVHHLQWTISGQL